MKYLSYMLILCAIAPAAFSQPTFKSMDTLLTKNVEAINLKDSAYYLSLLNQPAIFKGKALKTKADSLKIVKPFLQAFSDMIEELADFAGSSDMEVKFESYRSHSKASDDKITGRILVHVNLLINNTFTVTVPFSIAAYNGTYAIESPMMVMFADN